MSVHRLPILLVFGGLLAAGLVIDQDPPPPTKSFRHRDGAGATGRVAGLLGDIDMVLSWCSRAARRQRGRLRDDHEPD